MKACFFPVGSMTRASSRYRSYNIISARPEFIKGELHENHWKDYDVLVFQRTLDSRHLRVAEKAKKRGKLVILDITDFYFYWNVWGQRRGVKRFANVAHMLTTGNKDDEWLMKKAFEGKIVYTIRNAQPPSKHRKKHSDVKVPTVGWIGQETRMIPTLGEIWPVFERLSRDGIKFRVVVINNSGNTHGLRLPGGNEVIGKKWVLDKVDRMVAKWDVGVCPQCKMPNGRYHKEENKAVTCWRCGVPCVTFRRTRDWYGDIKKFLTDWQYRRGQGQKAPRRAEDWSPSVISGHWLKIMERHRGLAK